MDYRFEYIKLKGQHERLKLTHHMQLQKLLKEIDMLKQEIINPVKLPTFDMDMGEIMKIVCSVTNVLTSDILSTKRHREIVTARALFCYICRNHSKKPFARIGIFINRDHSTIMHLNNNYTDYLKMELKEETYFYEQCINRINHVQGSGIAPHHPQHGAGSNLLCEEIYSERMESV